MARKPGTLQVPEKDAEEDGRVRITRGGRKGKSKVTVRMRGQKAVRGKKEKKKWEEEPGMDINEQEGKTEKGQRTQWKTNEELWLLKNHEDSK